MCPAPNTAAWEFSYLVSIRRSSHTPGRWPTSSKIPPWNGVRVIQTIMIEVSPIAIHNRNRDYWINKSRLKGMMSAIPVTHIAMSKRSPFLVR